MITQAGRIQDVSLAQTIPPALGYDPRMVALGEALSDALRDQVRMAFQSVGFYYRIYELDERTLDILAADLHADWYDYNGSLEEKRNLIARDVEIHRSMGTVAMLRAVIESIHGDSVIEEWMEYGGKPYFFRLAINITDEKEVLDQARLLSAVKTYKPVRAWLEDNAIAYRWQDVMLLSMRTGYLVYTGPKCGTIPDAAMGGAAGAVKMILTADGTGAAWGAPKAGAAENECGIYPAVAAVGAGAAADMLLTMDTEGSAWGAPKAGDAENECGIYPDAAAVGAADESGIQIAGAAGGTQYQVKKCGDAAFGR